MPTLVPTLQPKDWPNLAYAVHQPLVNGDSAWMPWLTFADDEAHTRSLRSVGDAEALRQESVKSLVDMPYVVNVMEPEQGGPPFRMAVLEGGEYAGEQILNPAAMRDVAQRLGCTDLAVAVPFRGAVFAVDMKLPKEQMGLFLTLMSSQYFHARSQPISPVGLMVLNGTLCGEISGMEEAGRDMDGREEGYVDAEVSGTLAGSALRLEAQGTDHRAVTDAVTSYLMRGLAQLKADGVDKAEVHVTFLHLKLESPDEYRMFLLRCAGELFETGSVAEVGALSLVDPTGPIGGLTDSIPMMVMEAVGQAPVAVFLLIAMGDGSFEAAEFEAFQASLASVSSPLIKAGLVSGNEDIQSQIRRMVSDPMAVMRSLTLTATLPQYDQELGVAAIQELMGIATRVAAVSAEGPVRSLDDLRESERTQMEKVAQILGVKIR